MPVHDDEICFAVVPDTQIMARDEPDLYHRMTGWLADHADELGLAMVLHVGDVVHNGASDEDQFRVAVSAHRRLLDAGVPMLVGAGNHDFDDIHVDRGLTTFNRHVGAAALGEMPWFGGMMTAGGEENSFVRVDTPEQGYLFVVLEFGPRPETVAWAERLVADHRDRRVFVLTHGYLNGDGTLSGIGSDYHPTTWAGTADGMDGQTLWRRSLRRWPNLAGVFCGHQIPDNTSYRVDLGDAGNPVLASFQNWQFEPRGGKGRVRIVRWQPGAETVRMQVVNTATGSYETYGGYDVAVDLDPAAAGVCYPGTQADTVSAADVSAG